MKSKLLSLIGRRELPEPEQVYAPMGQTHQKPLSVEDTGPRYTPEQVNLILDRAIAYNTLEVSRQEYTNQSRTIEGAIAAHIADAHDGKVSLQTISEVGQEVCNISNESINRAINSISFPYQKMLDSISNLKQSRAQVRLYKKEARKEKTHNYFNLVNNTLMFLEEQFPEKDFSVSKRYGFSFKSGFFRRARIYETSSKKRFATIDFSHINSFREYFFGISNALITCSINDNDFLQVWNKFMESYNNGWRNFIALDKVYDPK